MLTPVARFLARRFFGVFKRLPPDLQARFLRGAFRAAPPVLLRQVLSARLEEEAAQDLRELVLAVLRRRPAEESLALAEGLGVTERLDPPPLDIRLSMSAPGEHPRRLACQKEPWTVRWIEESVKPGQVLYDIGANVGACHVSAWVHGLIELWAWGQPRAAICDRGDSPWDDAERRPSHADRRKALQRQCLGEEFLHVAAGEALAPEIQQFVGRLIHRAA